MALPHIRKHNWKKDRKKISHYYLSWTLTHMVDCDCLSIYYLGREIKWETHEPHRRDVLVQVFNLIHTLALYHIRVGESLKYCNT